MSTRTFKVTKHLCGIVCAVTLVTPAADAIPTTFANRSKQIVPQARLVVNFAAPAAAPMATIGISGTGLLPKASGKSLRTLRVDRVRSGNKDNVEQAAMAGAEFRYVLSDGWGYPGDAQNPASRGRWPYEDWSAWEDYVRSSARSLRGKNVVWEIWPYGRSSAFWTGSSAEYAETLTRAMAVLQKELGPNTRVQVPTIGQFDLPEIVARVKQIKDSGLQVAGASWAEPTVPSTLANWNAHARALVPVFRTAPVQLRKPTVSLVVPNLPADSPATDLALIVSAPNVPLVFSGPGGTPPGHDQSGGFPIFSALNGAPTALFWTITALEAGRNGSVWGVSTSPGYRLRASALSTLPKSAQIVIGRLPPNTASSSSSFQLDMLGLDKIPGFARHTHVKLQLRRVGAAPSNTLPVIAALPLAVSNGHSRTVISGLLPGEVFWITILPL